MYSDGTRPARHTATRTISVVSNYIHTTNVPFIPNHGQPLRPQSPALPFRDIHLSKPWSGSFQSQACLKATLLAQGPSHVDNIGGH
jgi:hypothetical protein